MTGIYYSDLFIINNKGCLVMGYGKSQICRSSTGDSTKKICSDSIRLENEDGELIGYADPCMGILPFNKNVASSMHISHLIRMLSEEETKQLKCSDIREIEKDQWAKLSDFNITYGVEN